MKLIIIRHGETEENKERIVQGQSPGKLSELGIEQAKKVAERLKSEKIDLIFSSDLARAANTAKEIIKFHSSIPFELKKELRERSFGKFEGQKREEIKTQEPWSDELISKYGGENPEEATKRIVNLKNEFESKFLEQTILIVTHNTIGNFLLTDLINDHEKTRLGNTSVTIFEFNKGKIPKLILLNCTKHLE